MGANYCSSHVTSLTLVVEDTYSSLPSSAFCRSLLIYIFLFAGIVLLIHLLVLVALQVRREKANPSALDHQGRRHGCAL